MTIKIRFHGDKAIIRWKHPGEAAFLKQQLTMFRDSMIEKMPISVKDEKGHEVPKLLRPKPPEQPVVIPAVQPVVLSPEVQVVQPQLAVETKPTEQKIEESTQG